MTKRPFSIWSSPRKKATQEANRAKGLCWCGKRPPTPGMKQCAPCREKSLAKWYARRQEAPIPYEPWRPEDELPDADEVPCGR